MNSLASCTLFKFACILIINKCVIGVYDALAIVGHKIGPYSGRA